MVAAVISTGIVILWEADQCGGNKRQSLKLTLVTTEKSFQYYGS